MFELEAWPARDVSIDALRPHPDPPDFESIVVDHLDQVASAHDALTSIIRTGGELANRDPDSAYQTTVGAVAGDFHEDVTNAPSSPAAALADAGDNAETIRQSVLRYLPQPSLSITADFIDPPKPPGGRLGLGNRAPCPDGMHWDETIGGCVGDTPVDDWMLPENTVRAAIRADYLELLGREPDAAGWASWESAVYDGHQTLAAVRDQIANSDEATRRAGGA